MVRSRLLVGLVGIFMFCLVVSRVFAVSSDEAQIAISRAESKMSLAYKFVLEAEKAGTDVSSLLLKLNNSSALLSRAQMQYKIGNFSETINFANQCFDSLDGIDSEAISLRDAAIVERKQNMLISAIASTFAIGAILYMGIHGWRFFKSKYFKQVSEMKPEVQTNDSG